MTIAEQLYQEGFEIGFKEGLEEIPRKIAAGVLREGVSPEVVAQATGLSLDTVLELAAQQG